MDISCQQSVKHIFQSTNKLEKLYKVVPLNLFSQNLPKRSTKTLDFPAHIKLERIGYPKFIKNKV